mgnify:CR=1 FL=1
MNLDEKLNNLIEEYSNKTEYVAEVTFNTYSSGGRNKGVILDKYTPYIYTKHGHCRAKFCKTDETEYLMPGDTGTVKLILEKPLNLKSGDSFAVYDSRITKSEKNASLKFTGEKHYMTPDTGERKPGYDYYFGWSKNKICISKDPEYNITPVAEGRIK